MNVAKKDKKDKESDKETGCTDKYAAEVGRIAESKMGHDKGALFIITAIRDADFVLIADGEYRKLGKPKVKRLKHLRLRAKVCEAIAAKLLSGGKVFDSEIKSALNKYKAETEEAKR